MSFVPSGAGRGRKICHKCKALCKSAQNNCAKCGVYLKKRKGHSEFSGSKPRAANCRRGLALSEAASKTTKTPTEATFMNHAEQQQQQHEQQQAVSPLSLPAPTSAIAAAGFWRPLLVRDDSVSVSRAAYSRTRRELGPYTPPLLARDDSTRSTQSMSEYRRLEDAIQAAGSHNALDNQGGDFSEGCTTDHEDGEDDAGMDTFGADNELFRVFAGPHAARFADLPPFMPAASLDNDV